MMVGKMKIHKEVCHKKNNEISRLQSCLKVTQLENKINHLERKEVDIDHKEFIKSNKLILKIKTVCKSLRYNVFTEEVNENSLRSNDITRMKSIDLVETYTYGMKKDLVSEKERIKCKNRIKQYKNG